MKVQLIFLLNLITSALTLPADKYVIIDVQMESEISRNIPAINNEDVCDPSPCLNGGSCSPTEDSYSCSCPTGYSGNICDVDVCDPSPCLNGGSCSPTVDSYSCSCSTGYSGNICDVSPCDAYNPCVNNGTCNPSEDGVNCSCPLEFVGVHCHNIDCNFDVDYCSWKQLKDDSFDWTRNRGKTVTANTGPNSDLNGSGYYVYTESSGPRTRNQKARLESPQITPSTSKQCLTFWYYMFGINVGRLDVYLRRAGALGNFVWRKSGTDTNIWRKVNLVISNVETSYSVVFEGVIGNGYRGDIAIDGVEFREGRCPADQTFDL